MNNKNQNSLITQNQRGIVLLVTLVLLVVLATLGYTLTTRVAAQRHRDQYLIDYQAARYGCESALKYALATLEDINEPMLISRPNEPDFSDIFALSEEEYNQFLAERLAQNASDTNDTIYKPTDTNAPNGFSDINDINNIDPNQVTSTEPNEPVVRGPYGSPWPFITEPVEFQVGSATVKIEIEDENAKYPLGWAILELKDTRQETQAGFETFCEWMDMNYSQIDSLKDQLEAVSEIKGFRHEFKPVQQTVTTRSRRRVGRRRRRPATRQVTKTVDPPHVHLNDFAKLFHSPLIDIETLAMPTVISDNRKESALKYTCLWASNKVNINSAPRHVLEAAFVFGGDQVEIAEEIIQQRKNKPFKDVEELRKSLLRYSDSIEKSKQFITTASDVFTIRVTATSGLAKTSAVIGIVKDKKKFIKIGVISG
jgi:DNA uptake protein ComE-like DNA-binding protein